MSSVNRVTILGRLGKDVEAKSTTFGKVANFSVATSETWKDKQTGEKKETTTWHNIVCWNAIAEIAEKYLHKGDQVYLEGKIQSRSYEKEGITKYITEIQARELVLLGGNKQSESRPAAAPPPTEKPELMSGAMDDLPF